MRASLDQGDVQVVAVNDPFIDLDYMVSKKFMLKLINCLFISCLLVVKTYFKVIVNAVNGHIFPTIYHAVCVVFVAF